MSLQSEKDDDQNPNLKKARYNDVRLTYDKVRLI